MATFDEMAIDHLLRGDVDGLRDLSALASAFVGETCPECGEPEPESNGDGSTFLCPCCSHTWDVQ